MLQRFKIPIIIVVTALLTQLAGYAVHASIPDALLPAGTTRYATLHSEDYFQTIVGGDGWVDVNHSTKYISIPGGQTADLMIIACTELRQNLSSLATDNIRVRALVRNVPASPAPVTLHLRTPGAFFEEECATFTMSNVAAGQPAIKLQMLLPTMFYSADVGAISMIVIVNTH